MADNPEFHLIGEEISVQEIGQGPHSPRLNRPDIAAKALGAMQESVEHAGGTMDNSHLRLIVDELRPPCVDPDCQGHFDYRGDTEQGPMYVCDGCKKIIYWTGSTGINGGTDV